jgi:hypothetical protein
MPRIYATRAQVIKIGMLLAEHLKPVDGGLFSYDGDWSDERVAIEAAPLGNPIAGTHVLGVRQELYGNLRKPPTDGDDVGALKAQIAELQKAAAAQAQELIKLADLHAKLCLTLSMERISDVRYLSGKPSLSAPVVNGSPAKPHFPEART